MKPSSVVRARYEWIIASDYLTSHDGQTLVIRLAFLPSLIKVSDPARLRYKKS